MTPAQKIHIGAFVIGGPCGSFAEFSERTATVRPEPAFPDAEVLRFTEISVYGKFTDAEIEKMHMRLHAACSTVAGKSTIRTTSYGLLIELSRLANAEQIHQLHRWLTNEEKRHRRQRQRPAA